MNNHQKKHYIGLIELYFLLLVTSSLIQQITYYGMSAVILIVLTIVLLVVLWKYLRRNHMIHITWTSMPYEPTAHKSERLFLFSLVNLVAPILRFHDITTYDLIVSAIALLVGIIGYTINERRLSSKKNKHT